MSNLISRIQRRRKGIGSKLGVHNEKAADLVARLAREAARKEK